MRLLKCGRVNLRRLALVLVLAGLFLGGGSFGMWAYGIRINMTRSLPLGLYQITHDPDARLVAFCPPRDAMDVSASRGYRGQSYGFGCPDGAPPLMKPVVAMTGQHVTVRKEGIAIEHRLLPNGPIPPRAD
jgi:type IV secretory pathway protease TraF